MDFPYPFKGFPYFHIASFVISNKPIGQSSGEKTRTSVFPWKSIYNIWVVGDIDTFNGIGNFRREVKKDLI